MHKKRKMPYYVEPTSVTVNTCVFQQTKTVVTKDSPEPTQVVTTVEKDVSEVAESLGLPTSDNYQLRDMLKAGIMPEMVNVEGMLDSQDPTDLVNLGVADSLYDALNGRIQTVQVTNPAPQPAKQVTEEPKTE